MLTETEQKAEKLARKMAGAAGKRLLWELFLPAAYKELVLRKFIPESEPDDV